jgi:hypothetical protein
MEGFAKLPPGARFVAGGEFLDVMREQIKEKLNNDPAFVKEVEAAKVAWKPSMSEVAKKEWKKRHPNALARMEAGQALGITVQRGEGKIARGERASTAGKRATTVGERIGKGVGKAVGKGTPPGQQERNKRQLCPCCEDTLTQLNKGIFAAHLRDLPLASAQAHYNSLSTKNRGQLPTGMTTKWFQEPKSKSVFTIEEFIEMNYPSRKRVKVTKK